MGNKIAVLRQGGVLAQYGTADELLGSPADEYVADFVGADRGLKRLSLRLMRDLVKVTTDDVQAPSDAPTVKGNATLRVGLSVLFASGSRVCTVVHEEDAATVIGHITLDQLQDAVYETAPTAPADVIAGEA
jgi:osmoprotectant transport system ATP-binding protein